MSQHDSPEWIAQHRLVSAMAVLENRVDLRSYPHRLLGVSSERGVGGDRVMYAIAAAEVLERFGWELVTMTTVSDNNVYAVLRRRGPQT
jgi:hypothetical protein